MLQVWTRFAIFGEIHSFPFPKILRKFRQSLDASRGHPTKFQLKKNFPRAPNISSNSWCALFLFKFRVSVLSFSRQCRFLQSLASISPVLALALLPVPPPYPVHRMVVWLVVSVGGDVSRQPRRLPRWQNRPWRPAGASPTVRRHPAPPKPPRASARPSSSLCVLQSRRRGLRGAEHALRRRRARELRSVEATGAGQIRSSLAVEWSQWNNLQLPGHLSRQLDHHIAIITRRRNPVLVNRLGPAINGGPELAFDPATLLHLTRTVPNH